MTAQWGVVDQVSALATTLSSLLTILTLPHVSVAPGTGEGGVGLPGPGVMGWVGRDEPQRLPLRDVGSRHILGRHDISFNYEEARRRPCMSVKDFCCRWERCYSQRCHIMRTEGPPLVCSEDSECHMM